MPPLWSSLSWLGAIHRLHALPKDLEHIVNRPEQDKVCITRPSEIYGHVTPLPADVLAEL